MARKKFVLLGRHVDDWQTYAPNADRVKEPHDHDVLCGRGGGSNKFPGNVAFRRVVEHNKKLFRELDNDKKRLLGRSIVEAIQGQDPPGRFLQRDENGLWFDIGYQPAVHKTCQALRELGKKQSVPLFMTAEEVAKHEAACKEKAEKEEAGLLKREMEVTADPQKRGRRPKKPSTKKTRKSRQTGAGSTVDDEKNGDWKKKANRKKKEIEKDDELMTYQHSSEETVSDASDSQDESCPETDEQEHAQAQYQTQHVLPAMNRKGTSFSTSTKKAPPSTDIESSKAHPKGRLQLLQHATSRRRQSASRTQGMFVNAARARFPQPGFHDPRPPSALPPPPTAIFPPIFNNFSPFTVDPTVQPNRSEESKVAEVLASIGNPVLDMMNLRGVSSNPFLMAAPAASLAVPNPTGLMNLSVGASLSAAAAVTLAIPEKTRAQAQEPITRKRPATATTENCSQKQKRQPSLFPSPLVSPKGPSRSDSSETRQEDAVECDESDDSNSADNGDDVTNCPEDDEQIEKMDGDCKASRDEDEYSIGDRSFSVHGASMHCLPDSENIDVFSDGDTMMDIEEAQRSGFFLHREFSSDEEDGKPSTYFLSHPAPIIDVHMGIPVPNVVEPDFEVDIGVPLPDDEEDGERSNDNHGKGDDYDKYGHDEHDDGTDGDDEDDEDDDFSDVSVNSNLPADDPATNHMQRGMTHYKADDFDGDSSWDGGDVGNQLLSFGRDCVGYARPLKVS